MFLKSHYGVRLFSVALLGIILIALLATLALAFSNVTTSDSGIISAENGRVNLSAQAESIASHPVIPANISLYDGLIIATKVFTVGSVLCALVLVTTLKMWDYHCSYSRQRMLASRRNRQLLFESLQLLEDSYQDADEDHEKGPTKASMEP